MVRSTIRTFYPRGTWDIERQHGKAWGLRVAGARLMRARISVADKGGASVSADRPCSRRFATMAQIESKHDVRRRCVVPRPR